MSKKIIKLNNFRMEFSKSQCKYNDTIKDYFKIPFFSEKNFNINNFEFAYKNKKIKYSTFYTCVFKLNSQLLNQINFDIISDYDNQNQNKIFNICDKIFISKIPLDDRDYVIIDCIISKKFKTKSFLDLKLSFIILWKLININKHIINSKYFFSVLCKNYSNYINNCFSIQDIINKIILNKNLEEIKIYMCIYILLEEFHYKYLQLVFTNKFVPVDKAIINLTYVQIDPLLILNNYNGDYFPDLPNLIEHIEIPLGHNSLLILNYNKIFYYDPDEQNNSDLYKIKSFLKQINLNFYNVSNHNPIQTIVDDGNCIFYCLRFINLLNDNQIELSLRSLQKNVYNFENNILKQDDMYEWIYQFIHNITNKYKHTF